MAQMHHPVAASFLRAAIFLSVLALAPLAHAQAIFADDEARRALLDLRVQLESLTKRLTQLERQLQTTAQGSLAMLNENQRLRSELAVLRGQMEEVNRSSSIIKSQQRDLYTDLDTRLQKIEPLPAALDQRLRQIEPVPVTVNGVVFRVTPEERAAFEAVREPLRSGDFQTTVSSANVFEQRFPNSPLLPQSLLLKGTAFYANKEYAASIAARKSFLQRYPNHPERAQATLNLAASQSESGNNTDARITLEGLMRDFPNTVAAAEAKERLDAIPRPAPPAPPPPKAAPPAPKPPPPKAPAKAAPKGQSK